MSQRLQSRAILAYICLAGVTFKPGDEEELAEVITPAQVTHLRSLDPPAIAGDWSPPVLQIIPPGPATSGTWIGTVAPLAATQPLDDGLEPDSSGAGELDGVGNDVPVQPAAEMPPEPAASASAEGDAALGDPVADEVQPAADTSASAEAKPATTRRGKSR